MKLRVIKMVLLKGINDLRLERSVFLKYFDFFFFFVDILIPFEKIFPSNIYLFRISYWKCLNLRKMSL